MKKNVKLLLTISFSLLVIIPIFFTSGCSPITKDDVINNLLPNLWVFLTHIFAAIVLLIVCIYLVWNPTKTSLAKRQAYIQNEINQAEEIKNKALKQLAIAEQSKIEAFENAKKIIEDANKQAYHNKAEIEQQAINNSQRIMQQAENDAKKIKTSIEQTMNQQIIDLAFEASSALLKSKVSKKDSKSFVQDFIAELEKQDSKNNKKEK
ncbi:MAG: hypothetical protein IJK72_00235 [Mycoplasma sp.]|nr:hypothetical protein [Mycoplasma sp.]